MRLIVTLLIAAPAAGTPALQAQVNYNARVGVTWATALLHDRIIDEIDVRQKLAPTVALGASLPIAPLYQAGLEVALTTSGYRAEEAGTETDLGTLRTGSVMLGLQGPISRRLHWRAGVGLLGYWPTEEQGMFLRGGTTRFLAGAGVDYRQPVMTQWDMMVSLRYDYHRFTTDELRTRGFSQTQGVQRIAATVGIARGRR
jgi:hypothetical protein